MCTADEADAAFGIVLTLGTSECETATNIFDASDEVTCTCLKSFDSSVLANYNCAITEEDAQMGKTFASLYAGCGTSFF